MISPPETVPATPGVARTWLAIGLGAVGGFLLVGVLVLFLSVSGQRTAASGSSASTPVGAAGSGAGALTEAPAEGYLAPQFTLPDLTGQAVSLKDFRGRPVWLNFWASWCGPCRAEMPEMQRIYTKYKDQGLVVLGVDLAESRETVSSYVTQNKYDWIFLLDQDQQIGRQYYVSGIPAHAFIDRAGVIRQYVISGLSAPTMESYLSTILAK